MNKQIIRALVKRDLKTVFQSKAVLMPLIIVPLIMFVAMPLLMVYLPDMMSVSGTSMNNMDEYMQMIPPGMLAELSGYTVEQQPIVIMLVYFLAPMFLILPIMVASVIAADSFAGEKERKTMEALLYTPATDLELFTAKMLSSWLPALAVALLGFVIYAVVCNVAGWHIMGRIFFPNLMWIVLILWVVPPAAGLGLGSMVLVSRKMKTFQEAYQMGGMVVLPVLLLILTQAFGVMYFSTLVAALLGLVLWLVDGVLIWLGVKSFQRGELIAQL